MGIMTLLHWLISEAIFMVDVQVLDSNRNRIADESFYGLAWGPTATLCAVIEGGLLIVFLYAYGFLRFPAGAPVLSSCSIAISAACHPSTREHDEAIVRPLRYGVLDTDALGDAQPVGFSTLDVKPLRSGGVYGGSSEEAEENEGADAASQVRAPSPSLTTAPPTKDGVPGSERIQLISPPDEGSPRARSRTGWRRQGSFPIS